ncbi:hypothetical protein HO133_004627 [Letharia lupina]|uniref:Uncharacterized protein n=1 Tax=Letharia lupina TaxID=560253 RepID=A0A8H6FKN2_9LECA|nr:uncharacterized protein HO133_004627 [Letharia lupina]KAF6230287.1 hypothetical protein HO133_004627 [Letharia lupina]
MAFGEKKWLQIMKFFLKSNVDLRGYSNKVDNTRRRILAVEGFGAKPPAEGASLRARVDKSCQTRRETRLDFGRVRSLGLERRALTKSESELRGFFAIKTSSVIRNHGRSPTVRGLKLGRVSCLVIGGGNNKLSNRAVSGSRA